MVHVKFKILQTIFDFFDKFYIFYMSTVSHGNFNIRSYPHKYNTRHHIVMTDGKAIRRYSDTKFIILNDLPVGIN